MSGTHGRDDPSKPIEDLIDEVRLLWNALVRRGEALHERDGIGMGLRAILEFLLRNGPTTVPNIARRRGVSRQHVQTLVNPLIERKWVRPVENPAHRRSPLMELTSRGRQAIERMRRREAAIFRDVASDLSAHDLERSAATLRALRRAVDA
jgi:DNA-binding MarR family transcriptional regulator